MNAAVYERLFQLNRCLEQAAEILEQLTQDGLMHPEAARHRKRIIEELRADLNYFLTGMLHRKELEECVGVTDSLELGLLSTTRVPARPETAVPRK